MCKRVSVLLLGGSVKPLGLRFLATRLGGRPPERPRKTAGKEAGSERSGRGGRVMKTKRGVYINDLIGGLSVDLKEWKGQWCFNPDRHTLRQTLSKIRRYQFHLWSQSQRLGKKVNPGKQKELKYLARNISRVLRDTAPCLDGLGEGAWPTGSFARWRHGRAAKNWSKEGGHWVRKE